MVKWRTFINMIIIGNVKPTKGKEKEGKHENQKIPLTLSFSHGFIIKG